MAKRNWHCSFKTTRRKVFSLTWTGVGWNSTRTVCTHAVRSRVALKHQSVKARLHASGPDRRGSRFPAPRLRYESRGWKKSKEKKAHYMVKPRSPAWLKPQTTSHYVASHNTEDAQGGKASRRKYSYSRVNFKITIWAVCGTADEVVEDEDGEANWQDHPHQASAAFLKSLLPFSWLSQPSSTPEGFSSTGEGHQTVQPCYSGHFPLGFSGFLFFSFLKPSFTKNKTSCNLTHTLAKLHTLMPIKVHESVFGAQVFVWWVQTTPESKLTGLEAT